MKKYARRVGKMIIALVMGGAAAVAAVPEAWHGKMTVEFSRGKKNEVGMYEVWVKGHQTRVQQLEPVKRVWLTNGENAYEIDASHQALEVDGKKEWHLKIGYLVLQPYFQEPVAAPEKKASGDKTVEGVLCTVYEYDVEFPGGRGKNVTAKVKEWRDNTRDVMLKAEVNTGGVIQKFTVHSLELNPALDQVSFVPSGDMKIQVSARMGGLAPDFSLKTVDEKDVKLSDYLGKKVLMVNLFGTWCGPCRAETPGFVKVYEEYKEKGVEFISVAMERQDPKKTIPAFQEQYQVPWPIVVDGTGSNIRTLYPGNAVPRNAIVGKDGKIIYYRPGGMNEASLKKLLDQALAN